MTIRGRTKRLYRYGTALGTTGRFSNLPYSSDLETSLLRIFRRLAIHWPTVVGLRIICLQRDVGFCLTLIVDRLIDARFGRRRNEYADINVITTAVCPSTKYVNNERMYRSTDSKCSCSSVCFKSLCRHLSLARSAHSRLLFRTRTYVNESKTLAGPSSSTAD